MHDAIAGETRGVPALAIMTTKFAGAARLMARVLGAEDYRFAVIEHPISSASPESLAQQAQQAASLGSRILTGLSDPER